MPKYTRKTENSKWSLALQPSLNEPCSLSSAWAGDVVQSVDCLSWVQKACGVVVWWCTPVIPALGRWNRRIGSSKSPLTINQAWNQSGLCEILCSSSAGLDPRCSDWKVIRMTLRPLKSHLWVHPQLSVLQVWVGVGCGICCCASSYRRQALVDQGLWCWERKVYYSWDLVF